MSQPVGNHVEPKSVGPDAYPLIEFPSGDFNDYYYIRQIWMAVVHNLMIRAISSIRAQAQIPVTDSDKLSFVNYILSFYQFVHLHHVGEEKFFFPECEKRSPGSMTDNVEQHEMFQPGLEALKEYCVQVQQSQSAYEGDQVVTLVEAFAEPFVHHLHEEIDTLAPEKLRSIFPHKEDYEKNHKAMMRWIVSNAPKTLGLPWILAHHDINTAPWYPSLDIPGVAQFVGRHILSRFNGSLWRWAPCTLSCVLKSDIQVGTVRPLVK